MSTSVTSSGICKNPKRCLIQDKPLAVVFCLVDAVDCGKVVSAGVVPVCRSMEADRDVEVALETKFVWAIGVQLGYLELGPGQVSTGIWARG